MSTENNIRPGWSLPNIIDKKMKGVTSIWWYNTNRSIDASVEIIKKEGALRINEHIHKDQWKSFINQIQDHNKKMICFTDCVPNDTPVPKNLYLVNLHSSTIWILNDYNSNLERTQNFQNIEYDFFLTYMRYDQERERIFKILEKKNLLSKSLYSCPAHKERKAKYVEGRNPSMTRYDHKRLQAFLVDYMHKCLCSIILENVPSGNYFSLISEKSLIAFKSKMPCAWIMTKEKKDLLESYGFKNSIPWDNHFDFVKHLSLLKNGNQRIWWEQQREIVEYNYKILNSLRPKLIEDVLDRLSKI